LKVIPVSKRLGAEMNLGAKMGTHAPTATPGRVRARSLPTSAPFDIAVFFSKLHFLGLVMTLTSVGLFVQEPNQLTAGLILTGTGFSIVTWIIAFFKRRSARCPLCKGSPLINSGARPHSKARRIFPFNHGVSATLSIIATQRFCCMYCGSDFDLLKAPSHLRDREEN
jgi:hypothetical protein